MTITKQPGEKNGGHPQTITYVSLLTQQTWMLRTQNEVKNSEGAKNLMKHRVLNEVINMNATIIFEKENNNFKKTIKAKNNYW